MTKPNKRGERQRVRSDWMAVERERGISACSAVMSFEHEGLAFKSARHAEPPGFQPNGISAQWDFAEDTYGRLTAVLHPSLLRSR